MMKLMEARDTDYTIELECRLRWTFWVIKIDERSKKKFKADFINSLTQFL